MAIEKIFDEDTDDELIVMRTEDDDLSENPFYCGPDSDYFRAKRGERGAALARQIVEVLENDPTEIDEVPLSDVVMKRHRRQSCLYMPTAMRGRSYTRCRTVYCVDLGMSGGTWAGHSLEDQFRMLSILLHGDLMNRALDDEGDWNDLLPAELIVITDRWDHDIAQWVPMLRAWGRLIKSFDLYLVAPGMVQRIDFEQ